LRLNLGSGAQAIPGYINIDHKFGTEAYPLGYPDESCDVIRASHVLEHFGHNVIKDVVKNWVSKLKPGGCLRIAVPDLEWVTKHYLDGEPINVMGILWGAQDYQDNVHLSGFDSELLMEIMVEAGLERIGKWKSELPEDCAAQPYSLNLCGYKPSSPDSDVHGVYAVMSMPRQGHTAHWQCVLNALAVNRIPVHTLIGCFWHQHVTNAIEDMLKKPDCEYILTMDYDTIFNYQEVKELYRIMRAYPHVDALCPVQSKRSCQDALFNIINKDGKQKRESWVADFECNVTRVTTGHFGLTFLRARKLREFQKPWMVPKPNKDGEWHDGHQDADINFWLHWADVGNTLYIANRVPVGHLEEVVSWPGRPDKSFAKVYQTYTDYRENGKPAEIIR
jgi:hypothetical protein